MGMADAPRPALIGVSELDIPLPFFPPSGLQEISLIPSAPTTAKTQRVELTQIVCDPRAIHMLMKKMLKVAGINIAEAARRLGCRHSNIQQYTSGRRQTPTLLWFIKFAALCGASIHVEFRR